MESRLSTPEILHSLLLREAQSCYQTSKNYLVTSIEIDADCVHEGCRLKISEWAFEVADHYHFDREVAAIAMNFLDRYIARRTKYMGSTTTKKEFQLLGVTCLYLAIKIHGERPAATDGLQRAKLKIDVFVELSRGIFSRASIESAEMQVLEGLSWRLNPPTCVGFVSGLLELLPPWHGHSLSDRKGLNTEAATSDIILSTIFEMARYFTEVSVCVADFIELDPSHVAYAAILIAIEAVRQSQATRPPHHILVTFYSNVAEATSMFPEMERIKRARSMLMSSCPLINKGKEDVRPDTPTDFGNIACAIISDDEMLAD